ncbi:putative glycoside hydrolase [Agaribacterium sp. ZY112]|uniref:putative glycoside hydrolase n=1 Tax=Agaribacterium sp. ZY112 TaxID=3233574 RepID=UPI0035234D36
MKVIKAHIRSACSLFLILCASQLVWGQNVDPTTNYFISGQGVAPWEFSLQFGQVKLENNSGKTIKGALKASPAKRHAEGDSIRLKWTPKDVRTEWGSQNENIYYATLNNGAKHFDLSSVKDQAALVFDVRVIKAPKDHVNISMESGWDWKTRSSIPIKAPLKKLPKKKWVSFPVPLQCFDNGKLDFSKITTVFMLNTSDKMELEIGDIRLAAFPADKVTCAKR